LKYSYNSKKNPALAYKDWEGTKIIMKKHCAHRTKTGEDLRNVLIKKIFTKQNEPLDTNGLTNAFKKHQGSNSFSRLVFLPKRVLLDSDRNSCVLLTVDTCMFQRFK